MNHSDKNNKGFGKPVTPAYSNSNKNNVWILSNQAIEAYRKNPDLVDEDLTIAAYMGLPMALPNKGKGNGTTQYNLSSQYEKSIARAHILTLCGISILPAFFDSEDEFKAEVKRGLN